mgnify:CR=1 FL=1|tara:strand:+ start:114 stop:734 length:621 start_codon:yes stop_codon:yes gene_type:complete
MSYNSLLSYGDFIPLNVKCEVKKLFDEIKEFSYHQYNPRKDIPRYGMSITSLDGKLGGIDLDSITQYNKENNTNFDELSFKEFTPVYYASKEIQKICGPFLGHIARSHILWLPQGGYFPPHRDMPIYREQQNSLRILVPLKDCNPPKLYFMYEDKPLHFEHGRAYFLNTNKQHNLFAYKDSYMIVLNIKTSEEIFDIIGNHFLLGR